MARKRVEPGQRRYEVQFETIVLESYYVNAYSKDDAIVAAEQKMMDRGSDPADDVEHIDTKFVTVLDTTTDSIVGVLHKRQTETKRKK